MLKLAQKGVKPTILNTRINETNNDSCKWRILNPESLESIQFKRRQLLVYNSLLFKIREKVSGKLR